MAHEFGNSCRLNDLIEILEELREELGGEAEVRLMCQPSWPFEYSIGSITTGAEINQEEQDECEDEDRDDEDVSDDKVIYLVEGSQLGYGSKRAWG